MNLTRRKGVLQEATHAAMSIVPALSDLPIPMGLSSTTTSKHPLCVPATYTLDREYLKDKLVASVIIARTAGSWMVEHGTRHFGAPFQVETIDGEWWREPEYAAVLCAQHREGKQVRYAMCFAARAPANGAWNAYIGLPPGHCLEGKRKGDAPHAPDLRRWDYTGKGLPWAIGAARPAPPKPFGVHTALTPNWVLGWSYRQHTGSQRDALPFCPLSCCKPETSNSRYKGLEVVMQDMLLCTAWLHNFQDAQGEPVAPPRIASGPTLIDVDW